MTPRPVPRRSCLARYADEPPSPYRGRLNDLGIVDFERGRAIPTQRSIYAVRKALENAGVEFIGVVE